MICCSFFSKIILNTTFCRNQDIEVCDKQFKFLDKYFILNSSYLCYLIMMSLNIGMIKLVMPCVNVSLSLRKFMLHTFTSSSILYHLTYLNNIVSISILISVLFFSKIRYSTHLVWNMYFLYRTQKIPRNILVPSGRMINIFQLNLVSLNEMFRDQFPII